MEDALLQLARERFGLDYLFPYQRLVITNILSAAHPGSDDATEYGRQIVILPTGAGKSLCFQLPAAALTGTTLVIYPLLSLMNDQARRMSEGGFSVVQLKGGQSAEERKTLLKQVRSGTVDFVISNPETLQSEAVRGALRDAGLVHAVIDEAHCIAEWGDTFRPLYLTLGETIDTLSVPIVTAFTATAGDHVLQRIREVLFRGDGARVIRGNPDRENISYSVVSCLSRIHALRTMFSNTTTERILPEKSGTSDTLPVWHPADPVPLPAIVFCATRAATRTYAAHLERVLGPGRTFYYHAGLDREQKKRVEDRFFSARDAVLCATCAYGMGVDKPDIRAVVHTYLPGSVEAFLQESGRGGRDRQPALSIVLTDPEEEHRYLTAIDSRTEVQKMAFGDGCRRMPLLRAMGTEPDACAGCDRCEAAATVNATAATGLSPVGQTTLRRSAAIELITGAVQRSPRMYTLGEWTSLLRANGSWMDHARGMPGRYGYGALSHWTRAELEEALTTLVETGVLRRGRNGRLKPDCDLPPAPCLRLHQAQAERVATHHSRNLEQ